MGLICGAAHRLTLFGGLQARCCTFAVALPGGIAASRLPELPVARYDIVLVHGLAVATALRCRRGASAGTARGTTAVIVALMLCATASTTAGMWVHFSGGADAAARRRP